MRADVQNNDHFVGWFHESHAQFMTSKVFGGSTGISATNVTMRQAHIYTGYTRTRYENWTFLEYFHHVKGMDFINNIWTKSPGRNDNARNTTDPFWEAARTNDMTWDEFGDLFGDFAMKSVIYDYGARKSQFRSAYNTTSISEQNKYQRYTFLEALDADDFTASNNRYVSPHAFAPQRLAFNIIRLYPDTATGTVTVRFRGDVQTTNNRPSYSRPTGYFLEPQTNQVHDNPGSDWRYGLVAVRGQAASTNASVTARYSPLTRAVNNGQLTQPDISMTLQDGETELYLVVAATPTANHKIKWDQYHYTIYRFPYMVEINGAKPEGFQANTATGRTHSNGGGFIANSVTNVPASVYVGPNARILGGTVSGNARIEGRAVVRGGIVRGNAVIRDYASVRGGTVEGDAIVSNGAVIWNGTINQNARVHGSSFVAGGTVTGTAQIGGVTIYGGGTLSGTAQALGDGSGNLTASSGIYYNGGGGSSGDPHGAARTTVPLEFTKPLSRTWYGDPKSITVTFNTGGGTPTPNLQEIYEGDLAEEPETPTKEGYNFAGWFDGETEFDFDTEITEDITLTAKWNETTPIIAKPHTLYPIPHTPVYYNLRGEPLGTQKPTIPGVYIEKRPGVAKRIVVR
ncbi:MAG: DUF6055 domain-containing protein [Fibromonadaceae bacterium]|nr:DUF6055 domain-containing protein [Fibromonadaceae bacterium]